MNSFWIACAHRILLAVLCESRSRHAQLYRRWAEGGAGLLITGNVQVDRRYLERPGNVCIDGEQDQEQLDRLAAFAAGGKAKGGHIWMQIGHAGRQSNGKVNYWPVGPSDIRLKLPKMAFGSPRALDKSEIATMLHINDCGRPASHL